MREHKYRYVVYHPKAKPKELKYQFFYLTLEDIENGNEVWIDLGYSLKFKGSYIKSKDQFIGLQDKNGKGIYEGDIVVLHCSSSHPVTATIKWGGYAFHAHIHDKIVKVNGGSEDGKMVNQRRIHTWCGMHYCLGRTESDVEVIGNIYENPELIKE